MANVPFTYEDYTNARNGLIRLVNDSLDSKDRKFLLSFESGAPDWSLCSAGDLSPYPSVKLKLLNIDKLKKLNPQKYNEEMARIKKFLFN